MNYEKLLVNIPFMQNNLIFMPKKLKMIQSLRATWTCGCNFVMNLNNNILPQNHIDVGIQRLYYRLYLIIN